MVATFLICLAASVIGGICGIGGGVIIKPVLDAIGRISVDTISFLSGITVLSMSTVSVIRQRHSLLVNIKQSAILAVGAVIGGFVGNMLFRVVKDAFSDPQMVGGIQAAVLGVITLLTLLYSCWLRRRLPSYHVSNPLACIAIGVAIGMTSVFLGIGGGPINLAVLFFAFSMDTKKAAITSLFIIFFSQVSNLVTACVSGSVPAFAWGDLIVMVAAGVLGGLLGSKINKKLSVAATDKLFAGLLCVIIAICVYNVCQYF